MSMNGVNLLPAHRRHARRRRAGRRAWTAAVAGYAAVLVVGYFISRAALAPAPEDAAAARARDLAAAEKQVVDSEGDVAALRPKVEEARTSLDATRAVSQQPDWGALLAVLSNAAGEEIVLTQCRLAFPEPASPGGKAAKPAAGPAAAPRVSLSGFGRSQTAVSHFALRLERTGLFERVDQGKTVKETLLTTEAFRFQAECVLKTRVEPAAKRPGTTVVGVEAGEVKP